MNALNINSSHSPPTQFSQPANLTTYTTLSLFSLQDSLLVSCHPSSTIRIFVITNHQPLFHIFITLPVESAPFFIPSTSFCSLSHLILRMSPHHSHHLRSHHLSLPQPFNPDLKLISLAILSSIVFLVSFGLL